MYKMYRLPIANTAALQERPTPKRRASLSGKIERTMDITNTVPKLNIAEPYTLELNFNIKIKILFDFS